MFVAVVVMLMVLWWVIFLLFFSPIFFHAPDLPLCINRDVPWCGAPWTTGSTSWDGRCLGFEVQTRLEPGALEEGGCCSFAGSLCCSWWYVVGSGGLVMVYFSLSIQCFLFLRLFLAFQFFPFYFYKLFKYPEAGLLILVSFWLDIYFSSFWHGSVSSRCYHVTIKKLMLLVVLYIFNFLSSITLV